MYDCFTILKYYNFVLKYVQIFLYYITIYTTSSKSLGLVILFVILREASWALPKLFLFD